MLGFLGESRGTRFLTLTALSVAAQIGCGSQVCPVVHVPRSQVPKLVDQYASEHRAVVDAERALIVTPEREPLLVVEQRVNVPGEAQPVTFPVQAPLGDVRRHGDRLVLGRQSVWLERVDEATLVFGAESSESDLVAWSEDDAGCRLETPLPEAQRFADGRSREVRAREAFERHHYLGLQLGGTGIFQIAYRVRAVDRLHVDMGFFASNGGLNTSVGLLYDLRLGQRTAAYLGAGGGLLGAFGENSCGEEGEPEDCVSSSTLAFGYLRAGFALRVGTQHRDVLGFDVGFWHGSENESGPNVSRNSPFTWPMAGFSYHRAL